MKVPKRVQYHARASFWGEKGSGKLFGSLEKGELVLEAEKGHRRYRLRGIGKRLEPYEEWVRSL